jgi:hypothetical protein
VREKRLHLGMIKRVARNESRLIGQLEPLFEAAADLSSWAHEYTEDERVEIFPNRGLVSWVGAPSGLEPGTLWQFRIEDQDFRPENPQHDAYRVASQASAVREVIDLRKHGTADEIRVVVTEQGMRLPFLPSESAYLWIEDDRWMGPVRLQRQGEQDVWMLPATLEGQPLPLLSLYRAASPEQVVTLDMDGARVFLAPGAEPGAKVGSIDWSPDAVVVKRVLRSVRKLDRSQREALQLTEKGIEHAADGLLGADRQLLNQQIQRAASIVRRVGTNVKLADAFLEELLEVPAVSAKLEIAKEEAVRSAEATFQTKMAGESQRLEGITREIEQSERALKDVESQVAARREAIAAQIDAVDGEMQKRLRAILEKPADFLANIGIVRAALEVAERDGSGARDSATSKADAAPRVPDRHVASRFQNWPVGSEIRDAKQVRQSLVSSFRAAGLSVVAARYLHTAFLAEKVPILYGVDSYEVLRAYASCVAGGRVLWMTISPGLLDPSELFGKADAQTGRFLPRAGGLADLMVEAQKLDGLTMVVLDGVNRSAVDAYLSPLVACYADSQKEKEGRRLAIAHASSFEKSDPYASVATLAWPQTVLLAGILASDVTSIPPSAGFWVKSALLPADAAELAEAASGVRQAAAPSPTGWMGINAWKDLRGVLGQKEAGPLTKAWSEMTEGKLRLPTALLEGCRSFYAAALAWPSEPKAALQDTLGCCVVPYVVSKGKEEELVEIASRVAPDQEAFRDWIALAKEVLA